MKNAIISFLICFILYRMPGAAVSGIEKNIFYIFLFLLLLACFYAIDFDILKWRAKK